MSECEDCVQRLDQLVDKELTEPEVKEVHLHLEMCGDCVKRYEFQEGLKKLVKHSCYERAPDALRERLRLQFPG